MAINPAHVALVRKFEPILHFAPGEVLFPADAKRYLEQCGLWKADPPFDNKGAWDPTSASFPRSPMIPYGRIAGLASEARPGDTHLGSSSFLTTNASEERFLDLAGWFGPVGASSASALNNARAVSAATENRFASLQGTYGVEGLYDAFHDVIPDSKLKDSRFWYHAEVFDEARIREVMTARRGLDIAVLLKRFPNPLLICYYFFFPGRLAPLQGCESTTIGPRFGSFGGEWGCMALLLNRASANAQYVPRFAGLTSRNIGQISFLDGERRVGMTINDWGLLTTVGDHARIFVARNTHGLYQTPGVKPLQPFTPFDPGLANCGRVESLDEAIPDDPPPSKAWLAFAKTLSFVGVLSVLLEAIDGDYGSSFGPGPGVSGQTDHPPDEGVYGVVVKPHGLALPDEAGAQKVVPWFVAPGQTQTPGIVAPAHSTTIGNRSYSFMVDRREADPAKRQVWWPSDGAHEGYDGRWGPRVANDPRGRRAGMRFPDFAQMFARALQQELSK